MIGSFQIFPISEVRDTVEQNPNYNSVTIYQGLIDPANKSAPYVAVAKLQRDKENKWNESQFDYLSKFRGNYTAVYMPGRIMQYLSNETQTPSIFDNALNGFNDIGITAAGSSYLHQDMKSLIERLVELEKENDHLKNEIQSLTEDLKEYETNRDRFANSLEMALWGIGKKIFPELGQSTDSYFNDNKHTKKTFPMQGTVNGKSYDLSDQNEDLLDDSIDFLVDSFSPEFMVKFARYISQNPTQISFLKQFIK